MGRGWAITLILASMVAVLAACGGAGSQGGSQGGDPVRVGVIVKDNTNPFMISVQDGAKAADSRLDAAEVMVDAARTETDIDDQIAKVEAMMSRGVQVLAIAPNAPQLEPVLDRAVNQGIDVMLIDSDIPGWDGETTLIGTDNRKASKVAVEQMAEEMGGEGKMGVVGIPGIPVVDERVDGARDAIEDTQIEIVQEVNGQSDQQVALNVTEDMLRRNPDLAAIWAPSGNNGLGAVRAAELAGKSDDILIYSFDGTEAELESVKAGKLDGSVAQRPEEMGELAVETALEVARGRDVAPEINTGFDVVTEENVDEFLKK